MKAAQNKDFVFRFSAPSPLADADSRLYAPRWDHERTLGDDSRSC